VEKSENSGLKISLEKIVFAFAAMIEYGDPFTSVHQSQVTRLACAMAAEMNLSSEQIAGLKIGGIIHDIGKIRIPPEILLNLNPLNKVEIEMVQSHPQLGCDILAAVEFPWPIKQIILQHHERLDGSGYPKGLFNEQIMLEAKIIAVADVMEAMISERPYRPGLGLNKAKAEISKNKGILYEPEAVDACLRLFNEKGFKFAAV